MRREYKVRVWRCIAFVGLFLCFLLGLGVGAYAQNANDILGKAAAAYENSKKAEKRKSKKVMQD